MLTEGVDQTEGNSGAGFYQDFYANPEISVSAAGQDVTTNTPGALVQVTVKSGGDQFKGLVNYSYEGRDFVGNNIDEATAARGFTGNPNIAYREAHGDLGGPILRNRLWFFYARNHFRIDKAQSGVPESIATDLGIVDDHTTKETWKASEQRHLHRLLPAPAQAAAQARPVGDHRRRDRRWPRAATRGWATAAGSACGATACSARSTSGSGATTSRCCRPPTTGSARRAPTW